MLTFTMWSKIFWESHFIFDFCLSSLEKHLIIYRIVRDTIVPWMHQQEALGNGTFDRMMLMHDGAPIHRAQVVTQWLEANVTLMCSQPCQQDVRIGRNPFTLNWPPYRGAFNDSWTKFGPFLITSYLYVDIFNPER